MASDSAGIERPRTLPSVLGHAVGALLVAIIGNGLVLPVVVLPALVVFMLSGTALSTISTALFGVFMALLLGIRPAMDRLYDTDEDNKTSVRDHLEADDLAAALAVLKKWLIMLGLYALYLNLIFSVTIFLSPTLTPYAVFVPAIDRVVLQVFDMSPAVLVVQSVAWIILGLGIVDELDLTFLRNPASAALG